MPTVLQRTKAGMVQFVDIAQEVQNEPLVRSAEVSDDFRAEVHDRVSAAASAATSAAVSAAETAASPEEAVPEIEHQ